MKLSLFEVNAFAGRPFSGNPAAVVPLERWLDDAILQAIANQNNLAETAFFVGGAGEYHIRWMTPTVEVDLCGHATLGSAWVIFEKLERGLSEIRFRSKGGALRVSRDGSRLALDFPSRPPIPADTPREVIAEALGRAPREVWMARDLVAVFDSEEDIRAIIPNMARIASLPTFALIATAPGNHVDFVSRFFAPAKGVPEDPVTGSSHCTLVPFWAERLGRQRLHAAQLSARGGELHCELRGERVSLAGTVLPYLEGTIEV